MDSSYQSTLMAPNTLATALPATSLNQSLAAPLTEPSSQFPPIRELPPPEGPTRVSGKHEMSRQQWEDVKPLIQRIYIDENKTFPYLAQVLRNEHGFEPTKRQFSRKVDKWGFRKNVSRSERQVILQRVHRTNGPRNSEITDRRVGPGKLENWCRRYRKEANIADPLSTQLSNLTPTAEQRIVETESRSPSNIQEPLLGLQTTSMPHTPPPIQNCDPFNIDFCPPNSVLGRSDWANVDVPGSPGLSRLFGSLELECSNLIPPLSLEEEDPEEPEFISNTELLDLWNGTNKSLVYEYVGSDSSKQPISRIPRTSKTRKARSKPWCGPGSGSYRQIPSPFNELYVFPQQSINASHHHVSFDGPFWMTPKNWAPELQLKLSKLKPLLGCEHPKILVVTRELARTYLDQGQAAKAEPLFRQVANTMQRTHGAANLQTLDAWLEVADCLQDKGNDMEAKNLLDKQNAAIRSIVHPGDDIAIKAMYMMSSTAFNLNDWSKAEELLRQVLQARLNMLGPTCQDTWKCISNLGAVLAYRRQSSEAEKLLRFALQLLCKNPGPHVNHAARAFNALASNYAIQGRFQEGEDLCRHAIERLGGSLDSDSPQLLNLYGRLAWSVLCRGGFEESEVLFRTTVKWHSKVQCERHRDALSFAEGLAVTLEQLGNIDEAACWYEKVYFGNLERFPPESWQVLSTCYGLGQFYQSQSRCDDALNMYRHHIRQIRKMQETESFKYEVQLAIGMVQRWMRAPEPDSFGTRDWFLRHFRKNAELLEDDSNL